MKIKTVQTILLVIAVMGVTGNSYDGSPESKVAGLITALCGFSAMAIGIYLWKKEKTIKPKTKKK